MGDTEQNLDAVLLVLVLLQDSSDEIHLVLGEHVLLVYFRFINKLDTCQDSYVKILSPTTWLQYEPENLILYFISASKFIRYE